MPVMIPPSKKASQVAYNLLGKPTNLNKSTSKVVRIINKVLYSANGARMIGSYR